MHAKYISMSYKDIEVNYCLGDCVVKYRLDKPMGAGGNSYFIMEVINDTTYNYCGVIIKRPTGWDGCPGENSGLLPIDMQILIEIIEEHENQVKSDNGGCQ